MGHEEWKISFAKADCEIIINKNFNKAVNWFRVVLFYSIVL